MYAELFQLIFYKLRKEIISQVGGKFDWHAQPCKVDHNAGNTTAKL